MMTETSVTVTTSEGAPHHGAKADSHGQGSTSKWLRINVNYFKTIPGIIKIVELALGILCMALVSPPLIGGTHWFLFVVVTSFIATLIWTFVYLLSIKEGSRLPINWPLSEVINTALITLFYFIAFIVQLSTWTPIDDRFTPRAANIAGGVFGLFNTLVYGAGLFFLYEEYKGTPIIVNH